jgi:hypothetical protein
MEFTRHHNIYHSIQWFQSVAPDNIKLMHKRMVFVSPLHSDQHQSGNHPIDLIFTHTMNMKMEQ